MNGDLEDETLGEHEILIRVISYCFSINNNALINPENESNDENMSFILDIGGIVQKCGANVTGFNINDEVLAITISLSSPTNKFVVLNASQVIKKPTKLELDQAISILSPGFVSYMVLFEKLNLQRNKSILICDALSDEGFLALQLAISVGAYVIALTDSAVNVDFLKTKFPGTCTVLDVKQENLLQSLLEETEGLGVDCIYRTISTDVAFTKHLMIRCLAINGNIATHTYDFELNSSESNQLLLRCASISFIHQQSWLLSCSSQSDFLHILTDLFKRACQGEIVFKTLIEYSSDKLQEIVDAYSGNCNTNKRCMINVD